MRKLFGSAILWVGVFIVAIGSAPLLAATAYGWSHGDPNPNPVVAGMFAAAMFVPGFLLIIIGLALGIVRFLGWIDSD